MIRFRWLGKRFACRQGLKDRNKAMSAKKGSAAVIDINTSIDRLKAAGFTTADRGNGQVLIGKHGCGAVIQRSPAGDVQFVLRPGLLSGEAIAHLLDRGFQKYWQSGERSLPATAAQLKALHLFEQDLMALMGMTSLYNQSLGTVSSRYVYDRIEGREGQRIHKTFD
jgi:hypothetical protein